MYAYAMTSAACPLPSTTTSGVPSFAAAMAVLRVPGPPYTTPARVTAAVAREVAVNKRDLDDDAHGGNRTGCTKLALRKLLRKLLLQRSPQLDLECASSGK